MDPVFVHCGCSQFIGGIVTNEMATSAFGPPSQLERMRKHEAVPSPNICYRGRAHKTNTAGEIKKKMWKRNTSNGQQITTLWHGNYNVRLWRQRRHRRRVCSWHRARSCASPMAMKYAVRKRVVGATERTGRRNWGGEGKQAAKMELHGKTEIAK